MAKYTGPIEHLEPGQQVNTILFRLAEAMGHEISGGIIHADVDDILDKAVFWLKNSFVNYKKENK